MPNSSTEIDYDGEGFLLYRYAPSMPAAAVVCALFAIVTFVHCWLQYRSRAWFLTPLIIGGFFELIGYASRAYSATQTPDWKIVPYVIQSLLPLVAPALFAASIYMVLGRIILMTDGEAHSLIRKKWLTKIFVLGDVLAFMVQAGGSGFMSAGGLSSMKTGEKIVIGGLFVQIIIFSIFLVVAVFFQQRMRRVPTLAVKTSSLPWKRHLYAIYISSGLIMARSLFRVVEFIMGNNGYLFSHEWFLYVFDALLMWFVLILLCWVHPGDLRQYLDRANRLQSDPESQSDGRHTNEPLQMQSSSKISSGSKDGRN